MVWVAALIVSGSLLLGAGPAAAHVDLRSTSPENVSTVAGPVENISFTFSGSVEPVAERFRVQDSTGTSLAIRSVVNDGPTVVVLTPEAPLPQGRSRVTWALRGSDGHTMTGTIAFTVAGSTPSTPPSGSNAETSPTSMPALLDAGSGQSVESEEFDVADFENDGETSGMIWAERVATFARWLVYSSLLFCVGGLGYVALVHRGTSAESRRLVFYVRRAATVVAVFSVLEWITQLIVFDFGEISSVLSPQIWFDLGRTGFGQGTLLRLFGAALVIGFLKLDTDRSASAMDPQNVGVGSVGTANVGESPVALLEITRLRFEASPIAYIGAVLLIVSESFIGHTSSVTPRVLVVLSDWAHIGAGGLWAAGSFMIAATLWRRFRRGTPLDARLLATRFSVVAAWSLVVVSVTGFALAWAILDSPSALWASEFGRLLLVKIAIVAVVAAIGAYNHRVLVPALVEGKRGAGDRFRKSVTIEAALFLLILLVTSLLVVASPY